MPASLGFRRLHVVPVVAVGAAVLCAGLAAPQAACAQPAGPGEPLLVQVQMQMQQHSNAFRTSHGLAPLHTAPALQAAAQAYAQFMADTGRYGHHVDGRVPAQRTAAQGYAHCMVAENIAYFSSNRAVGTGPLAQQFVQGWIDSPPHRVTMLSGEATDTGLAVAYSPHINRYVAVQLLGRPTTLQMRFSLLNHSTRAVAYSVDGDAFTLPARSTRQHTLCIPPSVQLQLPGQPQADSLHPRDGSSYRIDSAPGGGLQLSGG